MADINYRYLRCEIFWKVVNFSCCWHEKGNFLESPSFVVHSLKKTSWCLQIYPKGTQESLDDGIGVFLRRLPSKTSKKQKQTTGAVTFEISISVEDKQLDFSKSQKSKFEENSENGWKDFVKRSDLFVGEKSILPQDVLTVRCKILRTTNKKQRVKTTRANLRTVIKVTSVTFPWSIDNFGNSVACHTKPVPVKIFPELVSNVKDSTIRMSYSTNTNSEWFRISVCGQFVANWSWKCHIRFSNTSESYLQCSSIVSSKDNSRVWMYRPILNKKEIWSNKERMSNGILVLECDFSVVSLKPEQFVDDCEPSNEALSSACSSDSISFDDEPSPIAVCTTDSKDMSRVSPRTRSSLKQVSNEKLTKKNDDTNHSTKKILSNSDVNGEPPKSTTKPEESKKSNEEVSNNAELIIKPDLNEKCQKEALTVAKESKKRPSNSVDLNNSDDSGSKRIHYDRSTKEKIARLNKAFEQNGNSNPYFESKKQKEILCGQMMNNLKQSLSKRTEDRKTTNISSKSNTEQNVRVCHEPTLDQKQPLSKILAEDKNADVSFESNSERLCDDKTLEDTNQSLDENIAEQENIYHKSNSEKVCYEKMLRNKKQTLNKIVEVHEAPDASVDSLSKKVCNEKVPNINALETKDSIPSLQQDIKQIYRSRFQTDFYLKVGSQTFYVHKLILCARSATFRKLCDMKKDANNLTLRESETDADTASRMLEYIYTDDPGELNSTIAVKLCKAATEFKLKGLKKICYDYLLEHLDVNNVCDVLKLVDINGDEAIKSKIITFINNHEKEVILSNGWQVLMIENAKLTSETMFALFELKFSKG